MSKFERYDRQMRVPGFDGQAQQSLKNACVLLIGAGGLGFVVASQLAGAGVGRIKIVDFDTIALSNLHRQWLYTEDDLGRFKAEVLARHLESLNSDITIEHYAQRLSLDNIEVLTQDASLIVDSADNLPVSYLLSDVAEKSGTALVSTSVNQRYGYVGIFSANGSASFRSVFPKVPKQVTSCDVVGVSGPAVTVMAGLQAQACVDWIANLKANLAGKVLYADLSNYSLNLIDCANAKNASGTPFEFLLEINIQSSDWVVDVRELDEVATQPQAFEVDQVCPLSSFHAAKINAAPPQRIVISCQSGQRAMIAAQQLLDSGRSSVAVVIPSSSN